LLSAGLQATSVVEAGSGGNGGAISSTGADSTSGIARWRITRRAAVVSVSRPPAMGQRLGRGIYYTTSTVASKTVASAKTRGPSARSPTSSYGGTRKSRLRARRPRSGECERHQVLRHSGIDRQPGRGGQHRWRSAIPRPSALNLRLAGRLRAIDTGRGWWGCPRRFRRRSRLTTATARAE